jgi:hypothetical protein
VSKAKEKEGVSPIAPGIDIEAMQKAQRDKVLGPDRVVRTAKIEAELNGMFARAFGSGHGAAALKHLRSITLESVAPAECTDGQLRYLEGMRFVVSIIENRTRRGQHEKS